MSLFLQLTLSDLRDRKAYGKKQNKFLKVFSFIVFFFFIYISKNYFTLQKNLVLDDNEYYLVITSVTDNCNVLTNQCMKRLKNRRYNSGQVCGWMTTGTEPAVQIGCNKKEKEGSMPSLTSSNLLEHVRSGSDLQVSEFSLF